MRRAMAAACISDPRELRHAIRAAGAARDILITELTIGETFFLRENGQFDFLKNTVLPELRATAADRPLRMWSAGCATGEEAYSLAMTLNESDWPGQASILGTDLAFARLVAARRARYTAWSMRGVSETVITRYFEQTGKHFLLRSEIRKAVEFRVLNLASADYPSLGSGIEQMDVIFCRNVLIYFDMATIADIAARLVASLAPGGWLFLGASDPSIAEFVRCEVVLTGAGLAYRPPGTTPGDRAPSFSDFSRSTSFHIDPPVLDELVAEGPILERALAIDTTVVPFTDLSPPDGEAASPDDSCEAAYSGADYEAAARLARAAIDSGDDREAIWIVLVRSIANRGDLEAAGHACAAALDRHRMSVELTHLHGVLHAEAGRYGDAAAAARRALYISPQYTMAHLALGDALSRTGDPNARKAFRNAEMLLEVLAPATPVPGGDGAEAGQLLRIARFRLETLAVTPRAVRR